MREPDLLLLDPDPIIPNSTLPVLIYRAAIAPKNGKALGFKDLYNANDWHGVWRNGIYDFHHFHSISHEVLGIEAGRAQVRLGGDYRRQCRCRSRRCVDPPAGTVIAVSAPRPISASSAAIRAARSIRISCVRDSDTALANIKAVALPKTDPVQGKDGSLLRLWAR